MSQAAYMESQQKHLGIDLYKEVCSFCFSEALTWPQSFSFYHGNYNHQTCFLFPNAGLGPSPCLSLQQSVAQGHPLNPWIYAKKGLFTPERDGWESDPSQVERTPTDPPKDSACQIQHGQPVNLLWLLIEVWVIQRCETMGKFSWVTYRQL